MNSSDPYLIFTTTLFKINNMKSISLFRQSIFLKSDYTLFFLLIILLFSFPAASQIKNTSANFSYDRTKANQLQILSYKPSISKQGKKGRSGKEGKAGLDLKVMISSLPIGDSNILRISISTGSNRSDTVYLNPRYGQVKIMADGGNGGNGGQQEHGTGTGGKGGPGGKIEVVFDNTALEYANCKCLIFSNDGGEGGWYGDSYSTEGERGIKGPPIYLMDVAGKILAIR